MTKQTPVSVFASEDFEQQYPLVEGLVATDGIQYSSVATFGTTPTEVFQKLIDPGKTVKLKSCWLGLTQMFTGLNGSMVGSIRYYWTATPEYKVPSGGFIVAATGVTLPITGTYQKAVGTLTTSEDTFAGYVPVASLPYAPFRLRLYAVDIKAATTKGQVKNSSIALIQGNTIPGT